MKEPVVKLSWVPMDPMIVEMARNFGVLVGEALSKGQAAWKSRIGATVLIEKWSKRDVAELAMTGELEFEIPALAITVSI